jgi:hypothetical protein
MSNPRGPSNGDQSEWARPPMPPGPPNRGAPPRRQPPPPPSESPTRHIRHSGRPQGPPGRDVPRPQQPGPPLNRPPQPLGRPPQQADPPPNPRPRQPGPPPPAYEQPTTRIATPPPADAPAKRKFGFFANRASIGLILVIALLLVLAGALTAELYTRHTASTKVAQAVQCEVQDGAKVSFGGFPPVLWQYITGDYSDISVQTAGNQIRSAKGMTLSLDIRDVNLNSSNDSQGTIGSLNGTITWSSDGIKQSIQDAVPVLGGVMTSAVTTNPGNGTVSVKGALDSATVKPQIANNGLSLQLVSLTALGAKVSTNTIQKDLDELTSKATQNYPLGIHATSVKVTSSGVEASFSSSNATIPAGGSQDPCFANL